MSTLSLFPRWITIPLAVFYIYLAAHVLHIYQTDFGRDFERRGRSKNFF